MKRLTQLLRRASLPLLSVVTALLFGAVLIVLTDLKSLSTLGEDPLGAIGAAIGGIFKGYGAMISGAFGDPERILKAFETGTPKAIATAIRPITETLVATTPLIFAGLGVAISFRAGMFNIGGEGQMAIGALGATITALLLKDQAPAFVILIAAILAGGLFGGFWGFIAGFLKARTGAHEVITTIMLGYIASQLVLYSLITDFIQQPGAGQPISKILSGFVDVPSLPLLGDLPGIRLDWGFVVALLMAAAVSFLLFRTTKGFELRAAGFNLTAARYAGMSAGGSMMLAMFLAGALSGIGGAFLVIGTNGQLSLSLSEGIGFNAIALALLAGLRPSGVVAAALLFGVLTSGGKNMGIESGIPYDLLFFIIALVIMFVAAPGLIRSIWRLRAPKAHEGIA